MRPFGQEAQPEMGILKCPRLFRKFGQAESFEVLGIIAAG
jgi:hypothetical protein